MGLYSDFHSNTRVNILSQDPLPSLERAYQLMVQDERVWLAKALPEDKSTDAALGFALHIAPGAGCGCSHPDNSHLLCTHCHKPGHEATTCWELVGRPE